ncbi:MAG: hypothetical protein RJA63_455 [Pseudomonadota bacterium]|jgi:hypothetical protein
MPEDEKGVRLMHPLGGMLLCAGTSFDDVTLGEDVQKLDALHSLEVINTARLNDEGGW